MKAKRLTPKQRAYYKKFHPDLDREKLERAGKVPHINGRNLERLSAATALCLYDIPAEFEPPTAWNWKREALLTRKMKQERRDWFVREVEKVWRDCGGKSSGAYWKESTKTEKGKYTGALLELFVELLDQFNAPPDRSWSRHSLFRSIKNRDKATGRRR